MAYSTGRLGIAAQTCCDPPLFPCPPRKAIPARLLKPEMIPIPPFLDLPVVAITVPIPEFIFSGPIACGNGNF